jgi:hypothetical protein
MRCLKLTGTTKPIQLGLFRSDYMVHVDKSEGAQTCVKQVEFNTIASSFGGLSSRVAGLHRNLQAIDAYPDALDPIINDQSLPESTSIPNLARTRLVSSSLSKTPNEMSLISVISSTN